MTGGHIAQARRLGRPRHRLLVATVITRLEGGAGALALRGVVSLDQDAFHPLVITGSGGKLLRQAADSGIEVLIAPALRATIAARSDVRAIRWLAAELAGRNVNVVHTHCAKAGAVGRLAARRAGTSRIVHTYHGFPFHEFQSAARRRMYIEVERRLGRITDVGLCVGAGVAAEAIRRELLPPERVRTIGVVVDGAGHAAVRHAAPPDRQARRRARHRLGVFDDSVIVGAVGRLTYQKAPDDFVTALHDLGRPDVTGVWIGGGELAEAVASQARSCRQRVVLTGDRSDVSELLPAFDIFALPSRYEGLPTAVAEAMVSGVPVIATAVNAVSDLVRPGVTGLLVPPGKPAAMASALRFMLDSPAAAAEMAAAALESIDSRYSEQALSIALSEAYYSETRSELGRYDLRGPVRARALGAKLSGRYQVRGDSGVGYPHF
jgi:glycosyltransferase involved in cell wall biosynthesis